MLGGRGGGGVEEGGVERREGLEKDGVGGPLLFPM